MTLGSCSGGRTDAPNTLPPKGATHAHKVRTANVRRRNLVRSDGFSMALPEVMFVHNYNEKRFCLTFRWHVKVMH